MSEQQAKLTVYFFEGQSLEKAYVEIIHDGIRETHPLLEILEWAAAQSKKKAAAESKKKKEGVSKLKQSS